MIMEKILQQLEYIYNSVIGSLMLYIILIISATLLLVVLAIG